MSQDSIERDRLLTRLDTNVQYLVEGHKNTIQALVDHAKTDDDRFKDLGDKFDKKEKKDLFFYGKIYGGSAVIGGIMAFIVRFIK